MSTSDVYVRCVNVNTYTVMVNTYIVISILYTNRTVIRILIMVIGGNINHQNWTSEGAARQSQTCSVGKLRPILVTIDANSPRCGLVSLSRAPGGAHQAAPRASC